MTLFSHTQQTGRGMGNVELVLAIVGVFFCISVGMNWMNGQLEDNWTEETLRDLAAEIVAVSEAANLAGVDLIDEGDVRNTLDRICHGATADSGDFKGQSYSVTGLSEEVKIRVSEYLRINYGRLEVISPRQAG